MQQVQMQEVTQQVTQLNTNPDRILAIEKMMLVILVMPTNIDIMIIGELGTGNKTWYPLLFGSTSSQGVLRLGFQKLKNILNRKKCPKKWK